MIVGRGLDKPPGDLGLPVAKAQAHKTAFPPAACRRWHLGGTLCASMCSLDDEDDIEDEDDVSWKVRRAAAKLLSAIILNYADALSEVRTPGPSQGAGGSALHRGDSWLLLTALLQSKPSCGAGSWRSAAGWTGQHVLNPVVAPVQFNLGRCMWHVLLREKTVTWADTEVTWLCRSTLWSRRRGHCMGVIATYAPAQQHCSWIWLMRTSGCADLPWWSRPQWGCLYRLSCMKGQLLPVAGIIS